MGNEAQHIARTPEQVLGKPTEIQRDASIDVARGIAIIAIVVTHVLRGLNAAHLLGHGSWIAATDRVLCLWELSVFAFLGGIFVAKSVSKRSMGTYLQERTFQFVVLYLLWTALQGGVQLFAARLVNNPSSIGLLLRVWAPTGQLWYLPWLVLATLAALAGSFLVSYVRARAQSLGFTCDSGLFARPERVVVTVIGLIFGGVVLYAVVFLLAVLTNLTALQRIREVWLQGRAQRLEIERESKARRAAQSHQTP